MNKRKKVILATIVIGVLLSATLVAVFLLRKDGNNNEKTVDNYVKELKKITPKEVTISETSGSVTKNKNSILSAIKNLDKFPSIPTGVTLEIKDDSKNLTLQGIAVTLVVKTETINKEVTGFKAKRSQSTQEIDQETVDDFILKLNALTPKEVTISETSGSITNNKNSIKTKLEALANFPPVPSGVSWEVKEAATLVTPDGVDIILVVSKGSASEEVSGFKAKRTKTQFELDNDSVNNVKTILDDKSSKVITIENFVAKVEDAGVPEKIVEELKLIIKDNLDGVTIQVKADDNNENIIHTGDGTGFIIKLSKGSASVEISDWKVLRTKTSDELISDNYKTELLNSYKNSLSTEILIKIDSTSGTLEENKASIIKTIKETYLFIAPPTGFDIRLKPGQNETIPPIIGIAVDIEIFKVSTGKTLALISKDDLHAFIVERSETPYEKIDSYFWLPSNKVVNIPYERDDITYKNLNDGGVLEAVKKALVFSNPDFWTTTLLNEITLKQNQNIDNFDVARDVIIKYGEGDNETEATINVKKLLRDKTIEEYFKAYENRYFYISSQVKIETQNDILTAIKDILESRDPKVWTITKNGITLSPNNRLSTLTKGANKDSTFKIAYTIDGLQNEVDLFVRHLSAGAEIDKYFSVIERNYEARKINIPSSTATLDTAKKIFVAIKNYLKVKDPSTWKDQLLNELAISSTNNTTSLVKGDWPKSFIVEYTKGGNKVTLKLKVKHLSE